MGNVCGISVKVPTKRIRVVHVVLDLQAGGLERMVADLLSRLNPAKFEVHLLALRYLGRHAVGLTSCCGLHVAPPMTRWTMIWPRSLAAELQRLAPDIVHTHSGVWYKTALAARMSGIPHLLHTDHGRHFPDPLASRVVDNMASRWTTTVVAVSEPLSQHLARKVVAYPGRIRTITNGIDTTLFTPGPPDRPLLKRLGVPDGHPVVGSLGRFDPIKGYDVVLQAFAELRRSLQGKADPFLVLAGEGPEGGRLQELTMALGLADRVLFPGWIDKATDLYRSFDVFVLGSRSEGTSMSLLESMSCGVCPVVTDVGGNATVLGETLRHRLVPPDDPSALAEGLKGALQYPESCWDDGAMARARVLSSFSMSKMVDQYEALYNQMVPVLPGGVDGEQQINNVQR